MAPFGWTHSIRYPVSCHSQHLLSQNNIRMSLQHRVAVCFLLYRLDLRTVVTFARRSRCITVAPLYRTLALRQFYRVLFRSFSTLVVRYTAQCNRHYVNKIQINVEFGRLIKIDKKNR